MNPQPSSSESLFYTILFLFIVICYAIKEIERLNKGGKSINYDLFPIAKIDSQPINIYTSQPSNTRQKKEKELTQLQKDCIDTLVALGANKRESRKKTLEIFKSNDIKNINDFLKAI